MTPATTLVSEPCPATDNTTPATTTLLYLGAAAGVYGHPLTLAAQLTDASGMPLAGRSLAFQLGTQGATATTDTNGLARVSSTPSGTPGPTTASVSFAGDPTTAAAQITQTVATAQQETELIYTGSLPGIAPQQVVSARLIDAETEQPITSAPLAFQMGPATAAATTDATGSATATLTLSADQATDTAPLLISFAGDVYRTPAQLNVPASLSLPAAFGAVVVRHAPSLNGTARIEGSLRQLHGEDVVLNGGATITGDLLLPGSLTVRRTGNPVVGSQLQGSGSPEPSAYTLTLNGNVQIGRLITRTDPITLSTIAAPPTPNGTRDVTLTRPGASIGDPATLRNLTLTGQVGSIAVPPGGYGQFTANGDGVFVFGVAGTTQPTRYQLQGLTLNGRSALRVVGPVIVQIAHGATLNGQTGAEAQPSWLTLNMAAGDVNINGGSMVAGILRAPSSRVVFNGQSRLRGALFADRLTLNGGALIEGLPPPDADSAPTLTAAQASPTQVLPGETFSVTLTVSNTSTVTATDVVARERFSGTTPISATAQIGTIRPHAHIVTVFPQQTSMRTLRQGEETTDAYLSRLAAADGQRFTARGILTFADAAGQAYAPLSARSSTQLGLPRLVLGLSAPACVNPGTRILYAVHIANLGSERATGGHVQVTFPDGSAGSLSLTDLAPGAVLTDTLTWTVPALQDKGHDESDAAYRDRLAAADGTRLTARATLGWQDTRGNRYGDAEQDVRTVERLPILTLTSQAPTTVLPGQVITLTHTIENVGSGTAKTATLRVTNPDGTVSTLTTTTLQAGQSTQLTSSWVAPALGRNTTEDNAAYLARLAALSSQQLTFDSSVEWTDGGDTPYGPTNATAQASMPPLPILALDLTGPDVVRPGEPISYTITVRNQGQAEATSTSLTIVLPDGTVQTPDLGGSLAPGESRQVVAPFSLPIIGIAEPLVAQARLTWQDRFQRAFGPAIADTQSTLHNVAPVAADDAYTVAANSVLTVTVPGILGNDTDPEGQQLTAVQVNEPAHGALAFVGNGAFVYVPHAGFTGTDSFSYTASDGLRSSTPASVVITVRQPATSTPTPTASPTPTPIAPTSTPTNQPITLLDSQTLGYYNAALGTILDGTQPLFPRANLADGDPTINPASEPTLTVAASILGNWLAANPFPLNANWRGPQAIPATWGVNTENAILYVVDAGPTGIANIRGNFGVDNGIFVWVNGQYKFGAMAPGGAPAFEYANIDLGSLPPGLNFIQILREDHGGGTGFAIRITGTRIEQIPTPTSTPISTVTPLPTITPTNTPLPEEALTIPGWIGGPANQSTVTGVVPITLTTGVTLNNGTIDYWPAANPSDVRTLATNVQSSSGATLATLDTTLLANGSYIIRLQGTNSSGATVNSGVLITVVGEYKPGRVQFSVTDLTVPVTGLPITIGRTYDSLERNTSSDFGYGWSLSVGSPGLKVDPANNVTITQPGGRRTTFYFTPTSQGGFFGFLLQPTYTPEAGVYGSLTANGCPLLVRSSGRLVCFLDQPEYRPTTYTYTDPYGRVFVMGADGRLKSIKDLNGNTLIFSANGIVSSAGDVVVPFERDSQGRITQVTDPDGNHYRYSYDAAGNLTSVTFPDVTNPITYTYDSSHLLTGAVDPRGNTMVSVTYDTSGRLVSETDALGHTTRYAYDLNTRTTTTTYPDGGTTTMTLDSAGNLLRQIDQLGHVTTYTYDSKNQRLSQTDALGDTTTYTYDSNGNRITMTDPRGNSWRTTYNQYGGATQITDPVGNVQSVSYDARFMPTDARDSLGVIGTFSFDARGSLLRRTDGNGQAIHYSYDAAGNILSETNAVSATTRMTYDLLGNKLTSTDPLNHTTRFSYDALGRQIAKTDPFGNTTRYEYDTNGNRIAVIDPAGRRTTYTYDAANRLTQISYPDGTAERFTYDFRSNRLTETNQAGHITRYQYDLTGQKISTTHVHGPADEHTISYGYDAVGRMTSETDERGNTTTYEYDPAGNRTVIRDALGQNIIYAYDAANRNSAITDANGRQTRFTYDARNHLTVTTYADGTTSRQSYDGAGRVIAKTDQGGKTISYQYDAVGQLIATIDALNQTARYTYDVAGSRLTITDANDHTTSFSYDALGRQLSRTLPLGMSETMSYDAVGNLSSQRDFNGYTTTYAYDALNRLLSKTPDARLGQAPIQFTYTPTGQRASMIDASGTTTYSYDDQDRLVEKATPQGTLTYTYDAVGNLTAVRSSNANGVAVDYSYDVLNRLATVTDQRQAAGSTTYSYDAASNLTRVSYPNGIRTTLTHDQLNRVTAVAIGTTTPLERYSYTLDPTGHRLTMTELNNRSVHYSYDALYRLTEEAIVGDAQGENGSIRYTYDAVGNRLSRTSTLANIASATYAYDGNDRLLGDTYDANGNSLASSGAAYTYDFENRLTTSTQGNTTMIYDGDGNRIVQTSNGVTTRYLVDDRNPSGYAQVVEELVGGQVQRTYTYGLDLISQNLSSGGTWVASFYMYDALGVVRSLTDASGAPTDRYTYDAFGNLITSTGSTPNNYRFTGEQFDPNLGLYYLRARYYNTSVGRFWSRDSAEVDTDNPREINRYVYTANNPVNNTDPTGYTLNESALQLSGITIPTIQAAKGLYWVIIFGLGLSTIALTGNVGSVLFAQRGRGNISNYIVEEVRRVLPRGGDPCEVLDMWYRAARAAGDTKRANDIKQAQKYFDCRKHR